MRDEIKHVKADIKKAEPELRDVCFLSLHRRDDQNVTAWLSSRLKGSMTH